MTRTFRRLAVVTASLFVVSLSLSANAFAAGDPDHVSFTHEGCRLISTTILPGPDGFVCSDAEYTPGNLGKNWNELDNVPHRLTAENGGGDQTYTVTITADNQKAGVPGYDVISIPVLNKRLSTGGAANAASNCSLVSTDPDATNSFGGILQPGVGGMDKSLYRKLTIFEKAGAKCVFDWYARLALGSHLFPGSSLHTNLLNQNFTSAGIGSKDVSIPVKEILPQELGKSMSAHQGNAYGWDVSKTGTPSVNFNDSCFPNAPHSASVSSTITWTRTPPSPNGDITVTTTITVTNPSHRDVIANVTDTVNSGTTAVTPTGAGETNPKVFAPVTLSPNSTATLTNTIHVASGTTSLNDHAVATYTDPADPARLIPGQTDAYASATVQTSNTINQTATIVDNESISGDPALTYSIDSIDNEPSGSSITAPAGYTLGDQTTSSTWQSGTIDPGVGTTTASGSITFHKTIYLAGSHDIASASLDDTATLTDSGSPASTPSDDWSTAITANSNCPVTSIEIVKTGTPDVVHDGDNVTFTYAVSNPSTNTGSISDVVVSDDKCANVQGPVSKTGGNNDNLLDPGETWTYTCTTPALHSDEDANHVITNIATASGKDALGAVVSDQDDDTTKVIHPAIKIDKTGPATAQAGDKISYVLTVTNPGDTPLADSTIVVSDPQCNADAVTLLSKGGDGSPGTLDPGDAWTYTCSLQTAAGDTAVENHASVEGKDVLSKVVDGASVAATVLSQPAQIVLPARITPGSARLAGPTGCQSRAFNARIRGSKIATVTFTLDGKVVKKVKNTKNAKLVQLRVNPAKLKLGVHRLVVSVTFQSGSGTKPKTFRLSFQRCGKKLVTPRFTG